MKNSILFMRINMKRNLAALLLVLVTAFVLCSTTNLSSKNFTAFSTKPVKVAVIDNDKSRVSEAFIKYFMEELNIQVLTEGDFDFFSNELIDRKISVIIEIPKNYESEGIKNKSLSTFEVTSLNDYENAIFINLYIDSYLQAMEGLIKSANGDSVIFHQLLDSFQTQKIEINVETAYVHDDIKEQAVTGVLTAAGFYCMFIFFIGLSIAFVIMDDRLNGVFERIKVSPTKVWQYVLGTTVYTIVAGFLPILIFVIFLKMNNVMEVIPYSILINFMMLFNLISVAFCFMVAMLAKTKASILTIIIAFCSLGPILGGAYFPVTGSSIIIERISRIVPHYWYVQVLRDITEDIPVNVGLHAMILILFILLFTLISGGKFARKETGRA